MTTYIGPVLVCLGREGLAPGMAGSALRGVLPTKGVVRNFLRRYQDPTFVSLPLYQGLAPDSSPVRSMVVDFYLHPDGRVDSVDVTGARAFGPAAVYDEGTSLGAIARDVARDLNINFHRIGEGDEVMRFAAYNVGAGKAAEEGVADIGEVIRNIRTGQLRLMGRLESAGKLEWEDAPFNLVEAVQRCGEHGFLG